MDEDELILDPVRARRGGADLFRAGVGFSVLRSGLGDAIAARSAGRPWGSDAIGAAFEQNYRPVETAILSTWHGVGSTVENLGTAVIAAVDESVEADRAASGRVGRVTK
jgi:hypothetical protein